MRDFALLLMGFGVGIIFDLILRGDRRRQPPVIAKPVWPVRAEAPATPTDVDEPTMTPDEWATFVPPDPGPQP